MFGSDADKRIPVTITLANGEVLRGTVQAGTTGNLAFELNREGVFLGFKDTKGQMRFLAKTSVYEVVEGNEEKKAALPELVKNKSPYKVLKISESATQDEIRLAYVALAKLYHPDNYPAGTTPPELAEYVAIMFKDITSAYASLKDAPAKAA